jgi:zinc transporter ZupT
MLAATFWSLLKPALDIAQDRAREQSSGTETVGKMAVVLPVALGFVAGSLFVFMADILLAKVDGHGAAAVSLGEKS